MSKDLEKEYGALMDSEAPDLWARIESGLQEKKPVRQKKTADLRWAGLAAACACVALCIPVLKSRLPLGGSTFDAAAPNLASDMVVLECAPEKAALTAAEGAAAGGADEAVPKACDQPAVMKGDAGDESGIVLPEDIDSDNGIEEDVTVQEIDSVIVTAQILDIDLRMNSGIMYLAKVVSSEEVSVQAGSEIKIFCSALAAKDLLSLEQSQAYEMTLIKEEAQGEEDEIIYTLQSAVKP